MLNRKTHRSKLALAAVAILLWVTLTPIFARYDPIFEYKRAVRQPRLRSLHVLYSWGDVFSGFGTDKDTTLLGIVDSCQSAACLTTDEVFAGCTQAEAQCIPPWQPATDMPAGLLVPPINGYPPAFAPAVSAMLKDASTKCTSAMEGELGPDVYSNWSTLCVGQTGMVLYRSASL